MADVVQQGHSSVLNEDKLGSDREHFRVLEREASC